jgi:P-type Cu2+ transporter
MNQLNSTIAVAVCKFCDNKIETPAHFIEMQGESYPVCCPGCKKSAELKYGLLADEVPDKNFGKTECPGSKKQLTEETGNGSSEPDKTRFRARQKAGSKNFEMSLIVPDIRCAACTVLIENALSQRSEIQSIDINLSQKKVHVEFDAEEYAGEIVQLIRSLGYKVQPDRTGQLEKALSQERKSLLSKLGVAGIGMAQVMMFALATYIAGPEGMEEAYTALFRWASLGIAIPVAFYSASVFHQGAYRDLSNGSLGMDVPVSLAILSAFFLSLTNTLVGGGEVYFDTVCMFTFFLLVGRYVESGSRSKFQASQNLSEHLVPDDARVEINPEIFVPTEEIAPGSRIYVLPGETFPVDGLVVSGISSVDESAFTGEVIPVVKEPGFRVLAGSRNHDGHLEIETTTPFSEFVINKISELYQQSMLYKPPFAILADNIARYFVAAVLLLSACSGLYWYLQGSETWVLVSLTVLVVSCPCALSLATPVAYTVAATTLRKHGIVLNNGRFLERLAGTTLIAFDKTGTLTEGNLTLKETILMGPQSAAEVMDIAASLEKVSRHPIAEAFGKGSSKVLEREVVPGAGVKGIIDGIPYRLGEASFALENATVPDSSGMWVLLAHHEPLAWFRFEDKPRTEARETISDLDAMGYKMCLLTGDRSSEGQRLAETLGISDVKKGLSPEGKVNEVSVKQKLGEQILMVGDGINDTAAMGISDVSIAFSPVDIFVQSSADATLLSNNLGSITLAIKFARKARRIITQNIVWAVAYNICVIPIAVSGIIEPWMAALGMSLSSVFVVLNANRLMRVS